MKSAPWLIELLQHSAPTDLNSLRMSYPQFPELFSTERKLGSGIIADPEGARRAAVLELINKSLTTVARDMDALTKAIRVTMKRVARIRFFGAIVATVSGGITGVISLTYSNDIVQAVTAFIAMLGGIASATADQFERAPGGRRIASTDEYAKLVDARADIELFRLKIGRDTVIPIEDNELTGMLDRINDYAMSVLRLKLA